MGVVRTVVTPLFEMSTHAGTKKAVRMTLLFHFSPPKPEDCIDISLI